MFLMYKANKGVGVVVVSSEKKSKCASSLYGNGVHFVVEFRPRVD